VIPPNENYDQENIVEAKKNRLAIKKQTNLLPFYFIITINYFTLYGDVHKFFTVELVKE
jgi:hypothetical protein